MNMFEILTEVVRISESFNEKDDEQVIARLRAEIAFCATDDTYKCWMNYIEDVFCNARAIEKENAA